MNTPNIDSRIFSKVSTLSDHQKSDVLQFLESMPRQRHNTRLYRRKGLKQIRQALQEKVSG